MNFKSIFLLSFSLAISSLILAQDSTALSMKYQAYRTRLLDEFIDVGEGPGKMLIPGMIHPSFEPKWGGYCSIDSKGKGKVHFGDVTYRLGDYLAVLATEYSLYKKQGIKTAGTSRQIYYALRAIERLDSLAEHSLYPDKEFSDVYESNGFFIRDDLSPEVLRQTKWANYKWSSTDYGCTAGQTGHKNAMSHDQLIALLFGLTMVHELLLEGAAYEGHNLKQKTAQISDRLIQYLRNNEWTLVDPISNKPVHRGAYAQYQCYAIAEAGHRMTGRNYHSSWSNGLGKLSWKSAQYPFRSLSTFRFYSPYHGKKVRLIYDDVGNAMMLRLATMSDTWRDSKIKTAAVSSELEVFLLVHSLLNGGKLDVDATFFYEQLEQAPMSGPKYFGMRERHKWNSRDRWSHPESSNSGTIYEDFYGQYPGLDFMLMYNLYWLVYGERTIPPNR